MTSDDLTTLSLTEVAQRLCGADSGMKDPELWVRRRITAGQFRAIRVGRTFRMTNEQVREALESLQTAPRAAAPLAGLTPTSARRRRRSA